MTIAMAEKLHAEVCDLMIEGGRYACRKHHYLHDAAVNLNNYRASLEFDLYQRGKTERVEK